MKGPRCLSWKECMKGPRCLPIRNIRDPMDCSPPGSSVYGILQARICYSRSSVAHFLLQFFPHKNLNTKQLKYYHIVWEQRQGVKAGDGNKSHALYIFNLYQILSLFMFLFCFECHFQLCIYAVLYNSLQQLIPQTFNKIILESGKKLKIFEYQSIPCYYGNSLYCFIFHQKGTLFTMSKRKQISLC